MPSQGLGSQKLTAGSEREWGAGESPPALSLASPLRTAKLQGEVGSSGRGMLGAGEHSGARQLSRRGGWTPPWLAAPRVAPGFWSAPCHQLDPALHAPAGRELEAGWYGNQQTPQVPLTNEALLHPRAASLQEQGKMLLPEGSQHQQHPASLGISPLLPLPSAGSFLQPWASIICSSQPALQVSCILRHQPFNAASVLHPHISTIQCCKCPTSPWQ